MASERASDRGAREIRLAARPAGAPGPEHFELVDAPLPALADGQILVRNTWMSVDPYMRGRMDDVPSYIAPFALGAALEGSAVGEVVSSRADAIPVGTSVLHFLGWRDFSVMAAADARTIDTSVAPASAYLGVLGTPGLSAYVALTEVAPVRAGDVVFVSAAAGAVGSVAGQLAHKLGASRVIGSAGGATKAKKLVSDFGYDAAIDYRAGPVGAQLTQLAPDGIHVYVDSVGGEHLEAAIESLHIGGRVALLGAVGGYNDTAPTPGPRNFFTAYWRRLTMRGMVVSDFYDRFPAYTALAAGWLADGTLRTEETVVDGLERAPDALRGVLSGANVGKMIVRLAGDGAAHGDRVD